MVVRVSVRSVWTAETKSDVAIDEESIEDGAGEAGGGKGDGSRTSVGGLRSSCPNMSRHHDKLI